MLAHSFLTRAAGRHALQSRFVLRLGAQFRSLSRPPMRRLVPLALLLIVCLTHAHTPVSVCSVVAKEVQERKLNDVSICAGIAAQPEGLRAEACHDFISGYKTRLELVAKGDVSAAFLCDNLDLSPKHRHEGCTLWESFACITPIHAATTECNRRCASSAKRSVR